MGVTNWIHEKFWMLVRVDNTDISLLVNIMVISMENDISAKTGQYYMVVFVAFDLWVFRGQNRTTFAAILSIAEKQKK